MGKRDEAVRLLLHSNMTPGAIGRDQEVTLETICGYLEREVGRGTIRRWDILLTIPVEIRQEVFRLVDDGDRLMSDTWYGPSKVAERLQARGIDATEDDIKVVLRYKDKRFAFGDMYDNLRSIELYLHKVLREALEEKYGEDWWHKGIPGRVRNQCWSRKEKQKSKSDPYTFTDLPDLELIATDQWEIVSSRLPQAVAVNAEKFANAVKQLNRIRRRVMHPVRGIPPTDDDFDFVHELKRKMNLLTKQ